TNNIAIGIDFGTIYCCVAVVYRGKTTIIKSVECRNTTASYVFFNPDGTQTIGNAAKENALENPENTVYDAKRILGRELGDKQLQEDMQSWPFTVLDEEFGPVIQINGKQLQPEVVVAYLLKDLVKQAEKALGVEIRQAVVTVPAYFTDGQRQSTNDAAEIAGLEVLQILNEPTAAALAYKLERIHDEARKVLVFDLGGGTFDISILEIDGENIRILNIDGDTHLGGEDFDKVLAQYCSDEFKKVHGVDPFEQINSNQKPEKNAAKQRLGRFKPIANGRKLTLQPTFPQSYQLMQKDLKVHVTRTKFEELNAALFKKVLEIVERSLSQGGVTASEIDEIVLVGGSTRIPKVQQMLSEYFGGMALNHRVHPDEAVAYGAAVHADLLSRVSFASIQDVTPMTLGVEAVIDGVEGAFSPIFPKNTKIPAAIKKDNQNTAGIRFFQGESPIAKENAFLGEFTLTGIPPAPAESQAIDISMEIDTMGVLRIKAVVESTGGTKTLVVNEHKPTRISGATKQRLLEEMQASA
ncbi:78 kDa glucose-regulated protein, partial [Orchesella cincta]